MRYDQIVIMALACAALGGCANPNGALFLTDTSIGINVESKPPTASLAYDRTEGFIGPRYDNGAIPPVVASLQTGGNVFNPSIRQTYATGAAAVRAVGTPNAPTGATELDGGRQLAFFGTSTTLGFKAGFDTQTAIPDTFLFGYRRKEFSFIPLGSTKVDRANTPDVYASVLASIDSNTSTSGTNGVTGASAAGLTSTQFFATGLAADTLAVNPAVSSAFQIIAKHAATATLSADDRQKALNAGKADADLSEKSLNRITTEITPGGVFDQDKLKLLIDTANARKPGSISASLASDLENMKTATAVRSRLEDYQPAILALAGAIASP